MLPIETESGFYDENDLDTPDAYAEPQQAPITVRVTAADNNRFPDLDNIRSVVLKQGPRSIKEAKYATIVSRHTGEVHHYALTLQTLRKTKNEWAFDEKHTINLSSEGDDEIQKLIDFLHSVRSGSIPAATSEYLVVPAPEDVGDRRAVREILTNLSSEGKAQLVADVLERAAGDARLLNVLLERAVRDPQLFAEAAAALNLATYRAALEELTRLINSADRVPESAFQSLLTENPWMFGSEYSELLDRRRWTRDEEQDFVVRRTTDGYIELIEIKTPLPGANLFNYDSSHKSFYPGAELSKVSGQVQTYIEKLDARRDSIKADDGEDTCKIRAKIIIGRDGDDGQQKALRRLNGHLHRIEILTFDQLLRIAERVLEYLEGALRPANASTE
jgi:hypothetical protein